MSLMAKHMDLLRKRSELDLLVRESTGKVLEEGAKTIFEQFPGVESFGWRQYTPYFNDGDPCTFSAHTDYPDVNGEEYWQEASETLLSKADFDAAYLKICDLLKDLDEDALEGLFGDHVNVTVARDGVSTDECSHD